MRNTLLLVVGSLTALAGCATHPMGRAVEKGMILPEGVQQTELKPRQKFLMAAPIDNRLPNYPSAEIKRAETTICVEFIVKEDGRIDSVHQIDTSVGCEKVGNSVSAIFMPEVQSAVESWTYFGAAICDFEKSEDECDGDTAELTPMAIKLAYKFKFIRSNGQHRVTSGVMD